MTTTRASTSSFDKLRVRPIDGRIEHLILSLSKDEVCGPTGRA